MNITSTVSTGAGQGVGGAAGNGRKANILRQIRRLEAKRDELMKKLTGDGESKSEPVGQAQGTVRIGGTQAAGKTGAASDASQDSSGGAIDPGQVLRDLSAAMSSGQGASGGVPEMQEDPEQILKQIEMISMQILMLQRQLGDDAMLSLALSPDAQEKDAAELGTEALSRLVSESLPMPEVEAGHVDGYV